MVTLHGKPIKTHWITFGPQLDGKNGQGPLIVFLHFPHPHDLYQVAIWDCCSSLLKSEFIFSLDPFNLFPNLWVK